MKNCSGYDFVITKFPVLYRLEITAAKLQNKLKISSPWSAERDDVRAIAVEAKKKVVSSTVSSALGLAKERQFLYHLLAKYTSRTLAFFLLESCT